MERKPLGIIIIAAFELLTALGSILSMKSPFPFFTIEIEGFLANILWFVFSALSFYIGWGLWHLILRAWWCAIIVNILFIISMTSHYLLLGCNSIMTMIFIYFIFTLITIYLFKSKRYFKKNKTKFEGYNT